MSGQIEFPEFCNMMSAKMGTVNDEEMVRAAFRVLDMNGDGRIKSSEFKHLMTHIGNKKYYSIPLKLIKHVLYIFLEKRFYHYVQITLHILIKFHLICTIELTMVKHFL